MVTSNIECSDISNKITGGTQGEGDVSSEGFLSVFQQRKRWSWKKEQCDSSWHLGKSNNS